MVGDVCINSYSLKNNLIDNPLSLALGYVLYSLALRNSLVGAIPG
jgi:hypothetical protein